MDNNCFIKNYSEAADNDALAMLGYINFKVKGGDSLKHLTVWYRSALLDESIAVARGNCYFTDSEGNPLSPRQRYDFSNATANIYVKGDGYVSLSGKYAINAVKIDDPNVIFDIHELAFNRQAGDYIDLKSCGVYGDVSDIVLNYNGFEFDGKLTGSLKKTLEESGSAITWIHNWVLPFSLTDMVHLPNLTSYHDYGYSLTSGNISNFGYTKLGVIYIDPSSAAVLTGSVESLVDIALTAHPGESGYINWKWAKGFKNVYYNGKSLTQNCNEGVIRNADDTRLNWDSQGNITWT